MMTEYYHYIFTTLVSTGGTSYFLCRQNAIIYNVVLLCFCLFFLCTAPSTWQCMCTVWTGFLFITSHTITFWPSCEAKNTSICLSVWQPFFFSENKIKCDWTRRQSKKNTPLFFVLCEAFWTWATTWVCTDGNRRCSKADSLSCSWL